MTTFLRVFTSLNLSAEIALFLLSKQQQQKPYHKSQLLLFVFIFLKTFYEPFHT